jgi:peptide subunit release factor 1 (eRF1)
MAKKTKKIAAEGYKCEGCDELVSVEDAEEAGPLYECGSCGTTFNKENSQDGDSNRCPDCGLFSGKIADHCCPDCEDSALLPLIFA